MINHLLRLRCVILRSQQGQSTSGSQTDTWKEFAKNVPFSLRQLTSRERDILGRDGVHRTHRAYFKSSQAVTEKDRIVYDGRSFDVTGVNNPHELKQHLEVDLIERR